MQSCSVSCLKLKLGGEKKKNKQKKKKNKKKKKPFQFIYIKHFYKVLNQTIIKPKIMTILLIQKYHSRYLKMETKLFLL